MVSDASLRSIRRWLMLIALLLTIQIHYTAADNYSVTPGGNVVVLSMVVLGFFVSGSLVLSFVENPTE